MWVRHRLMKPEEGADAGGGGGDATPGQGGGGHPESDQYDAAFDERGKDTFASQIDFDEIAESLGVELGDDEDGNLKDDSGFSEEYIAAERKRREREERDLEAFEKGELRSLNDSVDDPEEDADETPEAKAKPKPEAKPEDAKPRQEAKPEATEKPEAKPEEPAKVERYEVKLDGRTKEVSRERMARALAVDEAQLDRWGPEVTTELFQRKWHYQTGAQRNAEERQILERFQTSARRDPTSAVDELLRRVGVEGGVDRVFQDYGSRRLQLSSLPPEQRREMEARQRAEQIEAEIQEREQRIRQEEDRARQARWMADFKADTSQALRDAGITPDARHQLRMLAILNRERQNSGGIGGDLTPRELVTALRSEIQEDVKAWVKGMDGPALIEALGQEAADAILRESVKRYRSKGHRGAKASPANGKAEQPQGRKPRKQREPRKMDDVLRDEFGI